jgi:Fic family protein
MCFKDTKSFAGKIRKVDVVIRDQFGNVHHRGAHPKRVNTLLKDLLDWYHKHKSTYPPLLLAAVVHNQFEHIHPYQDGNGRVGRILLNYILIQNKYPPVNVRQQDRIRYYETLQTYHKTGDLKTTIKFLLNQYKKMGHYRKVKK